MGLRAFSVDKRLKPSSRPMDLGDVSTYCDWDLGKPEYLDGGIPGSDHYLAIKLVRVTHAYMALVQQVQHKLSWGC